MTASAGNSIKPAFLLASDVEPASAAWTAAESQVAAIRAGAARVLGFDPEIRLASQGSFRAALKAAAAEYAEVFALPAALDFGLWQRAELGQLLAEARREHGAAIHHDDIDPGHPLVIAAFAEQIARAAERMGTEPRSCSLILAPTGQSDPASRAASYRLMRLLWEEAGLRHADVGFVRHANPFLCQVLEQALGAGHSGVVLPQTQWESEHSAYARVMLENLQRSHPEVAGWTFADPPGAHPALTAWYVQRITHLWKQKRERESGRIRSGRGVASAPASWKVGGGVIARTPDHASLRAVLGGLLPAGKPERVLVKVTWHGYATGTYTDPAALDLLLGALPVPAIVLEGHTSSRNTGGATFDWETEAQEQRAWIRQQEAEYLRRTGVAEVMARHGAQYVNVTEEFWDRECPDAEAFIPEVLLRFRGCPLISFAKMKGPTRLGISNLFGLLPEPLRSRWHGPNITWFAQACCNLARLWGAHFPLYGVVEGLYSAVKWNRSGLYRSRWGNYDLLQNGGYLTASAGLVAADMLASRMQGQDVRNSAFFDVVRAMLGWDQEAAEAELPEEVKTLYA